MKTLVLVGAAALALATGCSGGGKNSLPTKVTVTKFGGVIFFSNGPSGAASQAVLFSAESPELQATIDFSDGNCILPGTAIISTASTPTFIDAGASLSYTSGPETITALRDTSAGVNYFSFGSTVVPDTDWSVTNSGGPGLAAQTLLDFHLPRAITLTNTPVITPGSPADVTFTPDTGAQTVLLSISGDSGFVSCFSRDDGDFTIPAAATSAAGTNATVSVSAANLGTTSVGGRQVIFEIVSGP